MKLLTEQLLGKIAAPFTLAGGCFLFAFQAANVLFLGTHPPGPLLSDLTQLAMGILCVLAAYQATRRAAGIGRYFWGLTTLTFTLFVVAQALATYDNAFQAPHFIQWIVNILWKRGAGVRCSHNERLLRNEPRHRYRDPFNLYFRREIPDEGSPPACRVDSVQLVV